jgi:hypothetical protein
MHCRMPGYMYRVLHEDTGHPVLVVYMGSFIIIKNTRVYV